MSWSRRQLLFGGLLGGDASDEATPDAPAPQSVNWLNTDETSATPVSAEDILRRARRAPTNEVLPWTLAEPEAEDE